MGSNLYVKLDASYDDDPKILTAGEKAELLYVRGLCLAKRILSDGFIADVHLPRFGLSSVQARAKKLVEVGLWARDDDAGGYWIVSWLKHNTSKDEVEAIREGGARGNHTRWHVREGKPSGECEYCIAQGLAPLSPPDSPGDSPPDSPQGIPEAEAEAEITTSDLRPDPDVSSEARNLTRHFAERVKANGHSIPTAGTKNRDDWLIEMDRLLRLGPPGEGGHIPEPDEVRRVIDWCASDNGNGSYPGESVTVRSVRKFRERYSELRRKALRPGEASGDRASLIGTGGVA